MNRFIEEVKLIDKINELEELINAKDQKIRALEDKLSLLSEFKKPKITKQVVIKENINNLKEVSEIFFPKEHEFKRISVPEITIGSSIIHLGKSLKVYHIQILSEKHLIFCYVYCRNFYQNRVEFTILSSHSIYEFKPLKTKCIIKKNMNDVYNLSVECIDDDGIYIHTLISPRPEISINNNQVVFGNIIGYALQTSDNVFKTHYFIDPLDKT